MPEAIEDLLSMKRLWVHEVLRVFCDRLVDDSDRAWLYTTLHDVTRRRLGVRMIDLFARLKTGHGKSLQIRENELRRLVYCDFANPKSDQRHYAEVLDLNFLREIVEGYLAEFNNMSKKPMNLVLFRYSLCLLNFSGISFELLAGLR